MKPTKCCQIPNNVSSTISQRGYISSNMINQKTQIKILRILEKTSLRLTDQDLSEEFFLRCSWQDCSSPPQLKSSLVPLDEIPIETHKTFSLKINTRDNIPLKTTKTHNPALKIIDFLTIIPHLFYIYSNV